MIIEKADSFLSLRDHWNALLEDSSSNSIFLTYEWISTLWKYFGNGKELYLVTAKKNNRLIGIAPLMVEKTSVKGIPLFQTIRFIDDGISDYADFIVRDSNKREFLQSFVAYLKKDRRRWQYVDLSEIPENSSTNELLPSLTEQGGLFIKSVDHSICPYINLPSSWKEYKSSLNQTTKKNINMYFNRLCKKGAFEFHSIHDISTIPDGIETFFRLLGNRWGNQESSQKKQANTPNDLIKFHREVAVQLSPYLDLCFLRLEGVDIAGMYGYIYNNTKYFYLIGWNTEHAYCSPGFVTIMHQIEEAISKRLQLFDFLRGDEPYKYHFTKNKLINKRHFIAQSRFKFSTVRLLGKLKNRLKL